MGLLLCGALFLGETRRETWPDGRPRAEYEVELRANGREVRSGSFRSWHENGALESEGTFADDRETGRWTFYHASGERAHTGSFARGKRVGLWESFHPNGTRASKGRYEKGQRLEAWSFWHEDGRPDPLDSGVYTSVDLTLADGRRLGGERVDGQPHGEWRCTWPDGAPMFAGRLVRGAREGPWRFHHRDGSVAPFLSRVFRDDRALGPLAQAPSAAQSTPEIEPGRLGPPEDPRALEKELDEWLAAKTREAERALERRASWLFAGTRAVPAVLRRLVACDPANAEGRADLLKLEGRLLRELCQGHALVAPEEAAAKDEATARELVRTWASFWAATADDAWLWRVELALTPATPEGAFLREYLFRSTFGALEERRPPTLYARRFTARDPRSEAPLSAALEWLEAEQLPDGHWSSSIESGSDSAHHAPGVTALALLALLGAGRRPADSPAVAKAVSWLLAQQGTDSGRIPDKRQSHDWLYLHLMATQALCETLALQPSAALASRVQLAVDLVLRAQNPGLAWRYDEPPRGENDTSVTAWAVAALVAAREAGLKGDFEAALTGARRWIETATDPASGRVGYSALGELSARTPTNERFPREKGEAMTAAGLFARRLLGVPPTELMAKKQLTLLKAKPPSWDPEGLAIDEYYFYYGAQATALCGAFESSGWAAALAAVARAQSGNQAERGSWDPIGAWAYCGGRVYSTALLALALEAPFRYAAPDLEPKPGKK
jgi:hypothetical protein